MEPIVRVELTTFALQKRCSATELNRHIVYTSLDFAISQEKKWW